MKGGFRDPNKQTDELKGEIIRILYKNKGNAILPDKIDPINLSTTLKKYIGNIVDDIWNAKTKKYFCKRNFFDHESRKYYEPRKHYKSRKYF